MTNIIKRQHLQTQSTNGKLLSFLYEKTVDLTFFFQVAELLTCMVEAQNPLYRHYYVRKTNRR